MGSMTSTMQLLGILYWLVVEPTPLKNMKYECVSWVHYSQYMESHKIHVPNHQTVFEWFRTTNQYRSQHFWKPASWRQIRTVLGHAEQRICASHHHAKDHQHILGIALIPAAVGGKWGNYSGKKYSFLPRSGDHLPIMTWSNPGKWQEFHHEKLWIHRWNIHFLIEWNKNLGEWSFTHCLLIDLSRNMDSINNT